MRTVIVFTHGNYLRGEVIRFCRKHQISYLYRSKQHIRFEDLLMIFLDRSTFNQHLFKEKYFNKENVVIYAQKEFYRSVVSVNVSNIRDLHADNLFAEITKAQSAAYYVADYFHLRVLPVQLYSWNLHQQLYINNTRVEQSNTFATRELATEALKKHINSRIHDKKSQIRSLENDIAVHERALLNLEI